MLKSFSSSLGDFEFIDNNHAHYLNENKFTVIVGKNGTGKSRLLRSIVLGLISDRVDPSIFSKDELKSLKSAKPGWINIEHLLTKLSASLQARSTNSRPLGAISIVKNIAI